MRLRSGPQDLAFSYDLLAVFFVVHVLLNIVLAGQTVLQWSNILSAVVNSLFTLSFVFVMLQLAKKQQRFVQTLLALLGVEILLGLIGAALLLIYQVPALSAVVGLLWLVIIAWNIVVAAHIFRHSMETTMVWGMALAMLYIFLAYNVVVAISGTGEVS